METVYIAAGAGFVALVSLIASFAAMRQTRKLFLRQKRTDVLVTCNDLRLTLETLIGDIKSSFRLIPEDDPKLKSRLRSNLERVTELRNSLDVFRTRIAKLLTTSRLRPGVLVFLDEIDDELLNITNEVNKLAKDIAELRK